MKEISLDDAYFHYLISEKYALAAKFLYCRNIGFHNFGHFCDWLKQEGYAIV